MKLSTEERAILDKIDNALRADGVRKQILPIINRVRADLARKNDAVMTWEPIPLSIFNDTLPSAIRSAWIFVLRTGTNTGPERHPNSHQRMMTFAGVGDMQVGELGQMDSNVLISDDSAPLEQRWISIPQNVWHQPVVGKDADWTVVSFHTVPAAELIEERPASDGTKQMVYLDETAAG